MSKPRPEWFVIDHTTEMIKTDKGWTHLYSVDKSNVHRLRLYKYNAWALRGLDNATAYSVYTEQGEDVLTRLHSTDAWLRMTARLHREALA